MQGGCFYREELYHIREKCKGGGGSVGDPKGQGGGLDILGNLMRRTVCMLWYNHSYYSFGGWVSVFCRFSFLVSLCVSEANI